MRWILAVLSVFVAGGVLAFSRRDAGAGPEPLPLALQARTSLEAATSFLRRGMADSELEATSLGPPDGRGFQCCEHRDGSRRCLVEWEYAVGSGSGARRLFLTFDRGRLTSWTSYP